MAATPKMTAEELFALPVTVGLRDAARAHGIGANEAYRLAAAGGFPCEVKRRGDRWFVTRPDLFRSLGLDPAAVAAPADAAAVDLTALRREIRQQIIAELAAGYAA